VVGVGLIGVVAAEVAFAGAGVVYAIAALLVTRISDPLAHEHDRPHGIWDALRTVLRELQAGLAEVVRRPAARLPLTGIFILRTIQMFVAIAAILIIKRQYPEAGDRFGRLSFSALALAAAGVGAFIGAITAPALGRRIDKPRLILLGFGLSGFAILLLGGVASLSALLLLTFIAGYGGFLGKVATDALVQEAVPDDFRGRAFSIYDILYNLASVVAAITMVLLQGSDLRAVMIFTGAGTLAAALLLGRSMKRSLIGVAAAAA